MRLAQHLITSLFAATALITPFAAEAQVPDKLYDEITKINPLKKFEWTSEEEFKAGDKLILDVETLNGRKLSKIIINEPKTPFRRVARRIQDINRMGFTVVNDGQYSIKFLNNDPLPIQARIKIERLPETRYKDERILDDLVITMFEDSIQRVRIDTIPWPDLIEHEVYLKPSRDLEGVTTFSFTDSLLGKGIEQYAVYWIGIGDEALAAYNKIKTAPPPSWLMKGVNEPLIAFGMGLTKSLPVSKTPLAKNIVLQVRNPAKPIDPEDLTMADTESSMFGFVSRERAKKYNAATICGKNFNTVTGVKIYIKVARFSIVEKRVYDRVLRERVQEVFLQKPVPQKDSEE